MDVRLDEVALELIDDALAALLEFLEVVRGPPVLETTLGVELRAFIVEAVADLVTDDDADGAVVHRVCGIDVEGGRDEHAGGEDDLVEQRIVVSVGRRRRQTPAAAVGGLADLDAIVIYVPLACV